MILTPDNEYAVLLDACVLAPMPLCDTLLRLAEEPSFYRPLWSDTILQEVGSTLQNKLGRTLAQADRRLKVMREYFPEALVEVPEDLVNALTCLPDKNDRHVLAAAIAGHADAIVTFNDRDFPEAIIKQYGILRQSPDEFLVHQFHLAPEAVLEKLDAQALILKAQRKDVTARLRQLVHAPRFADLADSRS